MRFRDRIQAGRRLAARLAHYAEDPVAVVLALPRGGVPVAFEVAEALNLPLDVFLVRKLGLPGHEELAMGAVASGGVRVLNDEVLERGGVPDAVLDAVTAHERAVLEQRERSYRGDRPPLSVAGRTVLLVDDGLATGSSMKAALAGLARLEPARVVVAVPVAPPETVREIQHLADEVVCIHAPEGFTAVGSWYEEFGQTSDEEVHELLARAARRAPASLSTA